MCDFTVVSNYSSIWEMIEYKCANSLQIQVCVIFHVHLQDLKRNVKWTEMKRTLLQLIVGIPRRSIIIGELETSRKSVI